MPPDLTRWLLVADTESVLRDENVLSHVASGKLVPVGARHAPVHIDRSSLDIVLHGLLPTWAEWFILGTVDAIILSASGFGVTAAEMGGVPHAYFFEGCVEADLSVP